MKRAIVLLLVLVFLGGCAGVGELQRVRDQAAAAREQVKHRVALWEQRLEDAGDDEQLRANISSHLSAARAQLAALDAAVWRADLLLDEARGPSDPLAQGLGALAAWLPEPARSPLVLGTALAVVLLRARQLKKGMASIARGIDKAMEEDPEFLARFKRHADLFRSLQTPAARRAVDEATKDRPMLRLPI